MNKAIETANKNIKRILRKMTDNHKGWHEQLPYALLGYYTTARTLTGATPCLLVYGTKAVIPAEVEIPSLRIIQEEKLDDVEWVRARYEQLALINKKRMVAVCHGPLYRREWQELSTKESDPDSFKSGNRCSKGFFHIKRNIRGSLFPTGKGLTQSAKYSPEGL
ncbi:uncharacterized protein LOC132628502 [Lycium barbarum]|uniref:uncharacterized protein LOC132628502 n=1 Tax=Lycium barbarum TaxID=112863 RepID=UPI00293E3988|nr:uncharacterized protein LOC132628502 [Lycium barbarum]